MQEDGIEILVELFQFVGGCCGRVCHCFYIFYLAYFQFPVDVLAKLFQPTDVGGTDVEYIADIFFFYVIRFPQLVIDFL